MRTQRAGKGVGTGTPAISLQVGDHRGVRGNKSQGAGRAHTPARGEGRGKGRGRPGTAERGSEGRAGYRGVGRRCGNVPPQTVVLLVGRLEVWPHDACVGPRSCAKTRGVGCRCTRAERPLLQRRGRGGGDHTESEHARRLRPGCCAVEDDGGERGGLAWRPLCASQGGLRTRGVLPKRVAGLRGHRQNEQTRAWGPSANVSRV